MKYRLIQITLFTETGEYLQEYRIQKNYGNQIFKDWIDLFGEVYQNKTEALNHLEELQKNNKIKHITKIIKEVKTK